MRVAAGVSESARSPKNERAPVINPYAPSRTKILGTDGFGSLTKDRANNEPRAKGCGFEGADAQTPAVGVQNKKSHPWNVVCQI